MADQAPPGYRRAVGEAGVGFGLIASMMLIMAGAFQAIAGLVAVLNNSFYPDTREYLYQLSVTTWGWIHLLMGVLVALTGLTVLTGRTWSRVAGIVMAGLSALTNFLFLPHYPVWAVLIIAIDVLAVWNLTAHGREIRDTMS